ncbi:glutamate-5-semialdehyde dehydrogenase [Anaerobiospirillum thomasii]|uniref:Gamma-glutamyl phosphate reductase n=1 Tax=Anaerobiospirillum thomasii TaxID=179995 RepID=A0A2X0WSJ2_9GAMM|nr:glutamate-5-semialdehyde dehydrogenase [Anaerobiospirillum thomasii]SPT69532.1 Gamma-glutamyl phosphate reductase [Anaerobiospirillum thomasii]
MDIKLLENIINNAHRASFDIGSFDSALKNKILHTLHDILCKNKDLIFKENEKDINEAKDRGLNEAMTDRLRLNDARFEEMTDGILRLIALDDPVGTVSEGRQVTSGLKIQKVSVPFGLVGVIYESRPNVTVDIAALCIKSGNAAILRGGSEAYHTNLCLHSLIVKALKSLDVNEHIVSFIASKDREDVLNMLSFDRYIDVIIPRGGEALHRLCQKNSSIPVIVGGFGISHIFVDEGADRDKCTDVILNAKLSKPSACNSLDTLLIHKNLDRDLLASIVKALKEYKVSIYADRAMFDELLHMGFGDYIKATDSQSFDTEYLSLALNITFVDDVYAALLHMREHGAIHSDAILTENLHHADIFTKGATSACVYVNASTRFTDGGQFGMGAEVAISTQKLHVRGPMGLKELNTYKYICSGEYLSRK